MATMVHQLNKNMENQMGCTFLNEEVLMQELKGPYWEPQIGNHKNIVGIY